MAITRVQKATGSVPGGVAAQKLAVAFGADVTLGDLLVCVWSQGNTGSNNLASFSDTQGNVWTIVVSAPSIDTTLDIQIAYAIAKASGACTVTADCGGGFTSIMQMAIAEYSGAGIFDKQNGHFSGAGSPFQPGNITITAAHEVIVTGACVNLDSINDWAIDSGFTVQDILNVNNGIAPPNNFQSFVWGDQIVSAIGSFDPNFTTAQIVNSNEEVAAIASFKPGLPTGVTALNPLLPRKLPWPFNGKIAQGVK